MFVYTTSNIYLTPRFKLRLYFKFREIHGLKETMLLMTNDNLSYCTIDYQIFVAHREIFEMYIF